ncbi:MAG: hypothetical protein LBP51_00800 [Deferribacteraceae bacterium]|jgi:hypothetical protein|nr:hypothetical protein [Deferribacteraceae bacterium]
MRLRIIKLNVILSFFSLLLLISGSAFAESAETAGGVEELFLSAEDWAADMKGIVVAVDGSAVSIDIGADKKPAVGLVFELMQKGEDIIHPVTGAVLGQKQKKSGTASITKIFEKYSDAQFSGNIPPQVGDAVLLPLPLPVHLALTNISEGEEAVLKNLLSASHLLREAKQGKDVYTFNIRRVEDNLIYSFELGKTVLFSGNFSTVQYEYKLETLYRKTLSGGRFHSIAYGRVTDEAKDYLVGITEDEIYLLDAVDFTTVREIDDGFSKLLTVEAADLDKDGVSEIFVTQLYRSREIRSLIYRYKDGKFEKAAENLPWLFRSVNMKGERRLFVQKIATVGDYSGEIYEFLYADGEYKTGSALAGSLGKRLFGFSILQQDENILLNVAKGSTLSFSTFKGVEYNASGYFGDTFLTLTISSSTPSTSPIPTATSSSSAQAKLEKTIYVVPRIEILSDELFVIARNELYTRVLVNTLIFSDSYLEVYGYKNGIMRKKASSPDGIDPVVTDVFSYTENGEIYILALISNNPMAFRFGESSIVKVKLTLNAD